MKAKVFALLQKIGQSLMVPVSVLPAAGLLVALGRVLKDPRFEHSWIQHVGDVMYSGGLAVFEQLPMVFAIGVAIGFTGGAGAAGLASVVGYLTLASVLKVMSDAQKLDMAINTGVFGGIIMGLLSAHLYNRYYQIRLHPVFGFFSGKRFVPIVTAFFAIFVGLALGSFWPPIQHGIHAFGESILNSTLGPAFYAAGKRLLIPVGLHHVYYPPFLFQFGEFVTTAGQVVHGESARYFAGDPTAGLFMASEFPIMLFGLPAAALAMWKTARPERKKAVAGVMLTAALTSILTGITEPIEFAFIFSAPILYVLHVALAFGSGVLTHAFDIHLGYTFSASVIDMLLGWFNQKNTFYLLLVVGPLMGAAYFFGFYTLIRVLDLATVGREREDLTNNGASGDKPAVAAGDRPRRVLAALGGAQNLTHLDACITRLRISVQSPEKVNQQALKDLGAAGVMAYGQNFQIIFGVESDRLKEQIKSLMSENESSGLPIPAPIQGRILPLTEVPDETFAKKILGDGFAVIPENGVVLAPVDATVATVFPTGHALGLVTEDGVEILIHVGIDTVKMKGEGFKALVKDGDVVKAGQKLIEFDLKLVGEKAKSIITPVVVTNTGKYKSFNFNNKGSTKTAVLMMEA